MENCKVKEADSSPAVFYAKYFTLLCKEEEHNYFTILDKRHCLENMYVSWWLQHGTGFTHI